MYVTVMVRKFITRLRMGGFLGNLRHENEQNARNTLINYVKYSKYNSGYNIYWVKRIFPRVLLIRDPNNDLFLIKSSRFHTNTDKYRF